MEMNFLETKRGFFGWSLMLLMIIFLTTFLQGAGLIKGVRVALKNVVEEVFVKAFQEGSVSSIIPTRNLASIGQEGASRASSAIAGVGAVASSAQAESQPTDGALTVSTTPENATVKIMNISEKYSDGIRLNFDNYDIEVSAEGYRTKRFAVSVQDEEVLLDVNLSERGSFVCDLDTLEIRGLSSSEFGLQIRSEQVLPHTSLYETFHSLAVHLDEENSILHDVQADIGDDFAYLTGDQNSNVSPEQSRTNQRVEITDRRLTNKFGLEREGNNVRFIQYLELDGAMTKIDWAREAVCSTVESI